MVIGVGNGRTFESMRGISEFEGLVRVFFSADRSLRGHNCRTDFIWAQAMGYDGAQYDDSDGLSIGTADKPTFEYKYLEGRCRHYKLVGEPHGTGPNHPIVQKIVREMILGTDA